MGVVELILIAIGLAMDAFAVSLGKGLTLKRVDGKFALVAGAWFGGFQALMPIIGYLLGRTFAGFVISVDHWIAFVLLALIGINMIRDTLWGDKEQHTSDFSTRSMFLMAVATSIDALVVGISFPLSGVSTLIDSAITCGIIAAITFAFCLAGFYIGKFFGSICKKGAQIAGGAILIGLGIKILVEHMFFS